MGLILIHYDTVGDGDAMSMEELIQSVLSMNRKINLSSFLMKKILLSSLIATSILASAYTATDVSNANYLAEKNIIVQQSSETKYRLDNTITRAEVIGIALKIKGIILPEDYQCKGHFKDAQNNDWICRAVELAADYAIINASNEKARPNDMISRAEAL